MLEVPFWRSKVIARHTIVVGLTVHDFLYLLPVKAEQYGAGVTEDVIGECVAMRNCAWPWISRS